MLNELKKIFGKENEEVTTSTISYLAHRYKRFISGSGCVHCWHFPCKGHGKLMPSIYTPAEKIAYEYQKETQNK